MDGCSADAPWLGQVLFCRPAQGTVEITRLKRLFDDHWKALLRRSEQTKAQVGGVGWGRAAPFVDGEHWPDGVAVKWIR